VRFDRTVPSRAHKTRRSRSGSNNGHKRGLLPRGALHRYRLLPPYPRLRVRESAVNDQFWKCFLDNAHRSDRCRQPPRESKLRLVQSPLPEHPHSPAVFGAASVAPLSCKAFIYETLESRSRIDISTFLLS